MTQFEKELCELLDEFSEDVQSFLDALLEKKDEYETSQVEKVTRPNTATAAPVSTPAQTMRKNRDARIYVPASPSEKDTLSLSRPMTYSEFEALARAYIEQKYGATLSTGYGECKGDAFCASWIDEPQGDAPRYAKVMYTAVYKLHGTMRIEVEVLKNSTEVSFLQQ